MTDIPDPGPLDFGGPDEGKLTDAEMLAALETYQKTLKAMTDILRERLPKDMAARRVEKVGAYLPGGTKIASVSLADGRLTAKVTDEAAALKWCLDRYPSEVQTVQIIRPAFLKVLLEYAKLMGFGMDEKTGEVLSFIKVTRGDPYVVVTTTMEGVARMDALAHGFARMLEQPTAAAQ